ncbi:MAG TPA: hypothetical protein VFM67_11050 [Gaiella sp.]|nr:hypothetical protein [Gaiella sp.]
MTATHEHAGTTGSPDGPGRAGTPSVREAWAVGLSGRLRRPPLPGV